MAPNRLLIPLYPRPMRRSRPAALRGGGPFPISGGLLYEYAIPAQHDWNVSNKAALPTMSRTISVRLVEVDVDNAGRSLDMV